MAGVYEGECMGHSPGDEPLTLKRCHSYMKPLKVSSHHGEYASCHEMSYSKRETKLIKENFSL